MVQIFLLQKKTSILEGSFITHINLPSTLEPVGLTEDGRKCDGLTLGPG